MSVRLSIICLVHTMVAVLTAPVGEAKEPDIADLQRAAAFIRVEGIGQNDRPAVWTGSGVHVLSGGWVVTNRHVAPGNNATANTVRVVFNAGTADEYEGPGEVVAVHPDRDLALLKCDLQQEPPVIPLGAASSLSLTEPIRVIGFPWGRRLRTDLANASVSVSSGSISALRKTSDGHLWWCDINSPVAGGNSGSAVVNARGQLVGILTQRYEGFGKSIPVEYVQELLGQVTLDVAFKPDAITSRGGRGRITVTPRGPVQRFVSGEARLLGEGEGEKRFRLKSRHAKKLTGTIVVPPGKEHNGLSAVLVRAGDPSGMVFERVVSLKREEDAKPRLRATIHWVKLGKRKPNGWRWDGDEPDPFCKIYIDGLLLKVTRHCKNQYRFLHATSFDCRSGDQVRIVVYDRDVSKHDLAGEIRFQAGPLMEITKPHSGKIESCNISVQAIPLRPDSTD